MTNVCIIEHVIFLSREFMPSLDEFFAEAIEQADPANMVEDEYKYVRAKSSAPLSLSCGCVSLLGLILSIVTGLCGIQTTAGGPWGSCPGGVHIFSSQPIRNLRAWPTTWTAWSANWPKSCRWGDAKNLCVALKKTKMFTVTSVWPWLFYTVCRRIFLQKRSRRERRMMMTTETIFSKTAMTVSLLFAIQIWVFREMRILFLSNARS